MKYDRIIKHFHALLLRKSIVSLEKEDRDSSVRTDGGSERQRETAEKLKAFYPKEDLTGGRLSKRQERVL